MVATGYDGSSYLDSVETIRITETGIEVTVETCLKSVAAYPLSVSKAAGATLINGDPLICGGFFLVDPFTQQITDKCYHLDTNQWQEAPQLSSARYHLRMTTTDDTPFISGGLGFGGYLNDFHQLKGGSWQPLTPLPTKSVNHCLVALNGTHLLNIGGWDNNRRRVSK